MIDFDDAGIAISPLAANQASAFVGSEIGYCIRPDELCSMLGQCG
jgi:hypothetical protein